MKAFNDYTALEWNHAEETYSSWLRLSDKIYAKLRTSKTACFKRGLREKIIVVGFLELPPPNLLKKLLGF